MPVTPRKKSVALSGTCSAEEAETLLEWLTAHPKGTINIAKCDDMHSAIVQVLMATGRKIRGTPKNDELAAFLSVALQSGTNSA